MPCPTDPSCVFRSSGWTRKGHWDSDSTSQVFIFILGLLNKALSVFSNAGSSHIWNLFLRNQRPQKTGT